MKDLYLGSNSLNNGLTAKEYRSILNKFEDLGGRVIDTATNYPINSNPKDFMLNVSELSKMIKQSKMLIKLGSATNNGQPDSLINVEYLTMQRDYLIKMYGSQICGFGIHWDDQAGDKKDACDFLKATYDLGFKISLSGIEHPTEYSKHLKIPIEYQIRSSPCDNHLEKCNDLKSIFYNASVVGYGIYGGVQKRCGEIKATAKETLNRLQHLDKVIIMPSTVGQLEDYYV
jgi:hypothetical protein